MTTGDVPLLLTRIDGASVGIAFEAARVANVTLVDTTPKGAVDVAALLEMTPPASARCLVRDVDGQAWLCGTQARRASYAHARFQRVPGVLVGLRKSVGLIAILVEAGVPYLVLRPRAG